MSAAEVVERSGTWVDVAACRDTDTAVFFPPQGARAETVRAALAVCARCPVTRDCLVDALAHGDWQIGIRGGLTARERRNRSLALTGYADGNAARRAAGLFVDRRRAVS